MRRGIRFAVTFFCLMLFSLLLCVSSLAACGASYLFRLSGESSPELTELLGDADEVYGPIGIYETDDLALIEQLERLDALDYYEENGTISLASLPADESTACGYWARDIVNYGYAAANGLTGEGVTVAIIDSGLAVDVFAEYSDAEVLEGINCLDGSSDVADSVGHGTKVASVIADRTYGIAPKVSILPIKCFSSGSSSFADVVRGVEAAVESGCDVINMSMAAYKDNQSYSLAVKAAVSRGITVIAAVGNNGGTKISYPAAYEGVIGVGAVSSAKTLCSFSQRNSGVDVVAPGAGMKLLKTSGGYNETAQGTSFSSPLVAAAAALAIQADRDTVYEVSDEEIASLRKEMQAPDQEIENEQDPAETVSEKTFSDEELAQILRNRARAQKIEELLCKTAQDLGAAGRDDSYGCGLVNLALFLAAMRQDTQSVFLSSYGGMQYLSAWFAPGTEPSEGALNAALAFYSQDGRFLSLELITGRSADFQLNNYPVSGFGSFCRLMLYRKDSFTPVCALRRCCEVKEIPY